MCAANTKFAVPHQPGYVCARSAGKGVLPQNKSKEGRSAFRKNKYSHELKYIFHKSFDHITLDLIIKLCDLNDNSGADQF